MKKFIYTAFSLSTLLTTSYLNAQMAQPSILSTSGDVYENNQISLHFSLGELATETLSANDLMLTQGFIQPTTINSGIKNNDATSLIFNLYPNPATNYSFIEFNRAPLTKTTIEVININGKSVLKKQTNKKITELGLHELIAGTYLIKIIHDNGQRTSSKILQKTK